MEWNEKSLNAGSESEERYLESLAHIGPGNTLEHLVGSKYSKPKRQKYKFVQEFIARFCTFLYFQYNLEHDHNCVCGSVFHCMCDTKTRYKTGNKNMFHVPL